MRREAECHRQKKYFARAMRVRMPKVSKNLAPPETPSQPDVNSERQVFTSEIKIAPPPTGQQRS